jgi:succinylglutamate desuccinylase
MTDRIVGKYKGSEPGPLLVITAAMHGNEPAGVRALDLLFKMLEVEPITNPDFVYRGEIIGLIGNVQAYDKKKRYIDKDLNRSWDPAHISYLKSRNKSGLQNEDFEIRDLLDIIGDEINKLRPDKLYLLDLHTTSSDGGIFCVATHQRESIRIAHDIHAPVVLGLLNGIQNTTLHYFCQENIGLPTTAIAFEGGHHDDPESINRCIAATINFMRAIGVIRPEHVENRHDRILLDYAQKLPEVVEVFYKFQVDDNNSWQMKPGFKNFQKISKGEILARYQGKEVLAPMDGLILMPLYQPQGQDGFFICNEWNNFEYRD